MLSNFYEIIKDETVSRTYVVFSSIDIKPGSYMFWRVMNGLPGTKIFINDEDNGWYVHGIPTLGDTVQDASKALLKIINEIKSEEVLFIGPSMGGYAAMLYGSILKPLLVGVSVKCLSFGGEFLLYSRETRSGTLAKKEPNPIYTDIRPLLDSSGLSVIHIIGDSDINDVYQASLISKIKTIKIISLKNAPHAVSTYIGKNYNLIEFIRQLSNGSIIMDLDKSNVCDNPLFGVNLYEGHLALLDGRKDEALKYLQTAVEICKDHAIARHKYGIALLGLNFIDEALLQQNKALYLDPSLANAHYHLGIINTKLGKNNEALKCYNACINLNNKHSQSKLAMASYYFKMKKILLARKLLQEIIELEPKNNRAKDFLVLINKDYTE
jgi:hypothetical protein